MAVRRSGIYEDQLALVELTGNYWNCSIATGSSQELLPFPLLVMDHITQNKHGVYVDRILHVKCSTIIFKVILGPIQDYLQKI